MAMPRERRSLGELLAMGIMAGLIAFGLAYAARPRRLVRAPTHAATMVESRTASFELHAGAARLTVRSRDGTVSREVDLSIVVDGVARPLVLARTDLRSLANGLRAAVPIAL